MRRVLVSRNFPLGVKVALKQDNLVAPTWASESKSSNLLLKSGLVVSNSAGMFHYTPPMLRSINKLESLIDSLMEEIDAQKMQMSSFGTKPMWEKCGRWQEFGNQLIKCEIGGLQYCLCPTHEESISHIISNYYKMFSHTSFPIKLYQTTTKFRAESRPHAGLLRSREFLMNDLYTFDKNHESAMNTYEQVNYMYKKLFKLIGITVLKATATTGVIGGNLSHEYHIQCDVGEDILTVCNKTNSVWNSEHPTAQKLLNNPSSYHQVKGIEVGHTFFLGTCYSEKFKASYINNCGKAVPSEMGCFGLGVTRIIAACLEALSSSKQMRWPKVLAPYKVCILPPKAGSKEEATLNEDLSDNFYDQLQNLPNIKDDVIIDDRTNQTIGWRLKQACMIGYPVVVVIGKGVKNEEPTVEIIYQGQQDIVTNVSVSGVVECIKKIFENEK